MAIGALIRNLRLARGWSQDDLADALNANLPDATVTRSVVSRYESETRLPTTERVFSALSHALNVPVAILRAETKLSRVERRSFLSLAALAVTHKPLGEEIYASLAAGDCGPLAAAQTTHATDLMIASMVEAPVISRLNRWMHDGADAVLRVNAAGILAKLPTLTVTRSVASVLAHDSEVRSLYSTAVVSRVCSVEWRDAAHIVDQPTSAPHVNRLARKFAAEALNPRDAGARWCSANLLRRLTPVLGGPA